LLPHHSFAAVDRSTIIWYYISMKLSLEKVDSICRQNNSNVGSMLREAGVSRNAYYNLARKDMVVPQSLVRIAEHLQVPVADLLEESYTPTERVRSLITETERIASRHGDVDRDNVRHTLILLDEKPVDRLRRALRRGRTFDFR